MMTTDPEKIVSVAIRRAGETYSRGFKSHYSLRAALNTDSDADPSKHVFGDEDGFLTSSGRFVDRRGAVPIAIDAGQLPESWRHVRRDLLSSDLIW